MKVKFTKKFGKQYDKSPQKVKVAFKNRLVLFLKNNNHPLLNNHSLLGKFKGFRSINVTGDWRALFREIDDGELVFFEFIGTHSKLYK